jgi:S1-C subfamily serine protease
MEHPAMIRSDWRRRLRRGAALRSLAASAAFALFLPFSIPAAHALAPSGHVVQRPPGYLGIEFHDLTSDQAASLHLRDKRGVEVMLVDHDGPAAAAGLQPNDLITGIDGRIVASGEALRRMIRDAGAGVVVRLSVFRNGNPITIHARLANRVDVERKAWARLSQPDPAPPSTDVTVITGFAEGSAIGPAPVAPAATATHTQSFIGSILHGPFTGMEVQAMTAQLANFFGAPKGQGLLVQSVENGSPAAGAGIHAGDVLLRADNKFMRSTSDWNKHLHGSKGKPIALDLLRDHHEMTLTLQPETRK